MKQLSRLSLIILSVLLCVSTYAEDEVFLDLNPPEIQRYDTGKLEYENTKLNIDEEENYLKPSFQTLKNMFDEEFLTKDTVSKTKETR